MRVVIQQVDMDTALTGWLFGVPRADEIVAVVDHASAGDLADPAVLCIEVGGSGQTELRNFDHHDTPLVLPAACRQACDLLGIQDVRVRRLVDYVEIMDTQGPRALPARRGFPKLSEVFSGMRLSVAEPAECLFCGMNIFSVVVSENLDPFAVMPLRGQWQDWIERKRRDNAALAQELTQAQFFRSTGGLLVGYRRSPHVKILGGLYRLGCEIAIAHSAYHNAATHKYRVGSPCLRLDRALRRLQELEPGWGGPCSGTIFGSPRTGSALSAERVIQLVCQEL